MSLSTWLSFVLSIPSGERARCSWQFGFAWMFCSNTDALVAREAFAGSADNHTFSNKIWSLANKNS